jgi:hypothetical protein
VAMRLKLATVGDSMYGSCTGDSEALFGVKAVAELAEQLWCRVVGSSTTACSGADSLNWSGWLVRCRIICVPQESSNLAGMRHPRGPATPAQHFATPFAVVTIVPHLTLRHPSDRSPR